MVPVVGILFGGTSVEVVGTGRILEERQLREIGHRDDQGIHLNINIRWRERDRESVMTG